MARSPSSRRCSPIPRRRGLQRRDDSHREERPMSYAIRTRDEHFSNDGTPKRILALDGGGLRGILTLGYLERIEALLRERVGGDPNFRLSHYFDLIAGTSTGAIIAAGLASGWTVERLRDSYFELGRNLFEKSWFRHGLL